MLSSAEDSAGTGEIERFALLSCRAKSFSFEFKRAIQKCTVRSGGEKNAKIIVRRKNPQNFRKMISVKSLFGDVILIRTLSKIPETNGTSGFSTRFNF